MKLYLAYGSNLNLRQMAQRCPTAIPVGRTELKGHRLRFRGGQGTSVATVEPFEGRSVPCLVWRITAKDEASLDRYEGFPHFYRKEIVEVELKNRKVETMVYIMNANMELGAPSNYYYNTILEGYNTADFDISFLEQAVKESENA